VLLGITKASLQTRSVHLGGLVPGDHARADRSGGPARSDTLEGLKENVIVGRLIPAGTGGTMSQIRRIATSRDELILDERRKSSGSETAEPMLTDMTAAAQ
jgi:DNA-directed RNA polymerase subunit beta'